MPTPRATPIDGGEKLEDITGFCLSGGGYRAMLFHAGAIFRMNELGLLKNSQPRVERLGRIDDRCGTRARLPEISV